MAGCSSTPPLTAEQLKDPETCKTCHSQHYRDWSGSMHAYAADDPVFIAMNARGQRETNGALGNFCSKCHSPLGTRGVTCYFCHSIDAVTGTHDAAVHLATDNVLRGPIRDPMTTTHGSVYSPLHDRDNPSSAGMCGACHDIVTPKGAPIERTFAEWQDTVFAKAGGATCGQCHMNQSATVQPIADVKGAPTQRRYHNHALPGADVALKDFPESDMQKSKIQDFLATSLQSAVCVGAGSAGIEIVLDNVAAGHGFPSGSAQDRRVWVEVIAYANGMPFYTSGGDDTPLDNPDADLWLLRDCIFDEQQKPVHMFWEAATYESHQLPGQVTFDPLDPRFYKTHVFRSFPKAATLAMVPDRVTMRVRFQPIGLDVIDDLIGSGDLDPAIKSKMPTFDVGKMVEWTPATGKSAYVESGVPFTCVTLTNLNFQADKVPAPTGTQCVP